MSVVTPLHAGDDNPVTALMNEYGAARRTFEQLQSVPDPEPLIRGMLFRDSVTGLWGPSGAGKSFIALGMAMCVALKTPWWGRPVHAGPVLYSYGEGSRGMKARANAWVAAFKKQPYGEEILFQDRVFKLLEPHVVDAAIQLMLEMDKPPVLFVIDTVSRSVVGHNENDARDMSKFIDAAERIRHATQATVLFVHHGSKGGNGMRGSSVLRDNADTVIHLDYNEEDQSRTLICNKQKDGAPPFSPLPFDLRPCGESLVAREKDSYANF